MESPQQLEELRLLGQAVADAFKSLIEAPCTNDEDTGMPSRRSIKLAEERFRLWARELGLFQLGHSSLDYTFRDSSFFKTCLARLFTNIRDNLQDMLDIALGTRPPVEKDERLLQVGGEEEDDSNFSDDEASLASSFSSISSFQEAESLFSRITTTLDSLYRLAYRLDKPSHLMERPLEEFYEQIPESQRAEHIQNQENIEITRTASVQWQQLLDMWVKDKQLQESGLGREELITQYASASHWLIARVGAANHLRKQQFLYWKKQSQIPGRDVAEAAPELPVNAAPTKSMATSATKMDPRPTEPEDLTWPPPPSHLAGSEYFPCPYCGIRCPEKYLSQDDWRVHQIHDLRPYLCTYEDCSNPFRLYGAKEEWISHENEHRRVSSWHCYCHEAAFESEYEYMWHLQEQHPEEYIKQESYPPIIIAGARGGSAKPDRDCPFCPTKSNDANMMWEHVGYHLERLALYAFPGIGDNSDAELASEGPSDTRQVIENRDT
ncbi:hypothetical protein F5144DRAFT_633011 [Chaetomium tenue]|uniref:Uncharacterized protein n=1 Tax=Chaetomium tenue TaxID=1854479 RepID=A0ACB7P4Z7_9PEZI|nr:hypothetical protein F5144DRAFT_633011 [Chaetomium globosum]